MPTTEEQHAESSEQEVVLWRFEEMVRAGYSQAAALELSRRRDVDLHVACALLRRRCPPELAFRILV